MKGSRSHHFKRCTSWGTCNTLIILVCTDFACLQSSHKYRYPPSYAETKSSTLSATYTGRRLATSLRGKSISDYPQLAPIPKVAEPHGYCSIQWAVKMNEMRYKLSWHTAIHLTASWYVYRSHVCVWRGGGKERKYETVVIHKSGSCSTFGLTPQSHSSRAVYSLVKYSSSIIYNMGVQRNHSSVSV